MLRLRSSSKKPDSFFLISVFFLFIVTAGLLVLLGAGQYRDTVNTMGTNQEIRTASSYLDQKVHQHNSEDISVTDFCGQDALSVSETFDGKKYTTYIYYYDGSLRELFTDRPTDCSPSAGQVITELGDFSIHEKPDGLLEISLSGSDHIMHTLYLYPQPLTREEEP